MKQFYLIIFEQCLLWGGTGPSKVEIFLRTFAYSSQRSFEHETDNFWVYVQFNFSHQMTFHLWMEQHKKDLYMNLSYTIFNFKKIHEKLTSSFRFLFPSRSSMMNSDSSQQINWNEAIEYLIIIFCHGFQWPSSNGFNPMKVTIFHSCLFHFLIIGEPILFKLSRMNAASHFIFVNW